MQRTCSRLCIAQRSLAPQKPPGLGPPPLALYSLAPPPDPRPPPGYPPKRGPYRAEAGKRNVPRCGGKGNDCAETDVPEQPPHNFPPCVASLRTMWKSKRLNKRPNGGEIHSVELFPQKKLPFRPHLWKFISPPVKPLKRQTGHVSRFI